MHPGLFVVLHKNCET